MQNQGLTVMAAADGDASVAASIAVSLPVGTAVTGDNTETAAVTAMAGDRGDAAVPQRCKSGGGAKE